jgi:hypothetical protein
MHTLKNTRTKKELRSICNESTAPCLETKISAMLQGKITVGWFKSIYGKNQQSDPAFYAKIGLKVSTIQGILDFFRPHSTQLQIHRCCGLCSPVMRGEAVFFNAQDT